MKVPITCLFAFAASITLAACNGSDDASLDASAESVEMPADAALEGIEEQAVPDPAAALNPPSADESTDGEEATPDA